ncbi:MAG: hypothetical protein R3A44_15815 [Caldilineaceae bacterium]
MSTYKIGAIFYALWGLLHIVGAGVLMLQAYTVGGATVLAAIGSATPAAAIPQFESELLAAVLAYYAWNLVWIGAFVLVVAIRSNWRNDATGYWLNLIVVSAVDLGLVAMLMIPGHMAWSDGGLGVALWLPAILFTTLGQLGRKGVKPAVQLAAG